MTTANFSEHEISRSLGAAQGMADADDVRSWSRELPREIRAVQNITPAEKEPGLWPAARCLLHPRRPRPKGPRPPAFRAGLEVPQTETRLLTTTLQRKRSADKLLAAAKKQGDFSTVAVALDRRGLSRTHRPAWRQIKFEVVRKGSDPFVKLI